MRCGGGVNHRLSLGDAALIKDNHVAAAGSVGAALERSARRAPDMPCEVEVDTLDQFDEALGAGAELVLLDNFPSPTPRRRCAGRRAPRRLESSGGLTLDRRPRLAATGVDFLAVGALTHSAPALDRRAGPPGNLTRTPHLRGEHTPGFRFTAPLWRPRTLAPGRLPGGRRGAAGDRAREVTIRHSTGGRGATERQRGGDVTGSREVTIRHSTGGRDVTATLPTRPSAVPGTRRTAAPAPGSTLSLATLGRRFARAL